jgi:hypothetical protein
MDAARSPGWTIGEGRQGELMATFDTGEIGRPWVITARRGAGRYYVSRYAPGDNVTVEGESVGELLGNPRDMGRQLRTILEASSADQS